MKVETQGRTRRCVTCVFVDRKHFARLVEVRWWAEHEVPPEHWDLMDTKAPLPELVQKGPEAMERVTFRYWRTIGFADSARIGVQQSALNELCANPAEFATSWGPNEREAFQPLPGTSYVHVYLEVGATEPGRRR